MSKIRDLFFRNSTAIKPLFAMPDSATLELNIHPAGFPDSLAHFAQGSALKQSNDEKTYHFDTEGPMSKLLIDNLGK